VPHTTPQADPPASEGGGHERATGRRVKISDNTG